MISLGFSIHSGADALHPVRHRLQMARRTFWKLKPLLTDSCLSRGRRMLEFRKHIFPVALHGCEFWTFSWSVMRLVMVFEKKCLRIMFKLRREPEETIAAFCRRHTARTIEMCNASKHEFMIFAALRRMHKYVGTVVRTTVDAPNSLQATRQCLLHKTRQWWRTVEHLHAGSSTSALQEFRHHGRGRPKLTSESVCMAKIG